MRCMRADENGYEKWVVHVLQSCSPQWCYVFSMCEWCIALTRCNRTPKIAAVQFTPSSAALHQLSRFRVAEVTSTSAPDSCSLPLLVLHKHGSLSDTRNNHHALLIVPPLTLIRKLIDIFTDDSRPRLSANTTVSIHVDCGARDIIHPRNPNG
jgi:hypothetical protein